MSLFRDAVRRERGRDRGGCALNNERGKETEIDRNWDLLKELGIQCKSERVKERVR